MAVFGGAAGVRPEPGPIRGVRKSERRPLYAGQHQYKICTPAALRPEPRHGDAANTEVRLFDGLEQDKGTTTSHVKFTVISKGKCKAPFGTRLKVTGTVNSSTGVAATIVKKGEPVSAFLCEITKGAKFGQTVLEAGTTFTL
jgi:hypothetical protein